MISPRLHRVVLWAAVALLTGWVLTEVGLLLIGTTPPQPWYGSWGYWTVIAGSIVLIVAGTWRDERRPGWWAVALGLGCWLAGDMIYELGPLGTLSDPPIPNLSDVAYLLFYPAVWLGLGLLWRSPQRSPLLQWVDGTVVALTVAALVTAIVLPLPLHTGGLELVTLLSYPLADAILLGMTAAGLSLNGWRRDGRWVLLSLGLALFAVADVVFAEQSAAGSFVSPSLVDAGWMGGFVAIAIAALLPAATPAPDDPASRRHTVVPAGFALLALLLLSATALLQLDPTSTVLATCALAAVLVRLVLALRENTRAVSLSRAEARTDQLTGLGNRRALVEDLDAAVAALTPDEIASGGAGVLALFDLDGFKAFNDQFGHPAGDLLLARLGKRLQAAVGAGRAYRLGGDEYCVLLTQWSDAEPVEDDFATVIALARAALREAGPCYRIEASYGTAPLSGDRHAAEIALRLADQRMYTDKRTRQVEH